MLKLIKYELLRKMNLLIVSLIVIVALELVSIYTIYRGGASLILTTFIMFLIGFGGLIVIFVDSVKMYSSDLYKKPGYMLFLTPNNSFKIIGSKLFVSIIEGLFAAAIYIGMWVINYSLIYKLYYHELPAEARTIVEVFSEIANLPSASDLIMLVFSTVVGWFVLIVTVYLAITIRKTILATVKFGGFFSFIFFCIIYFITNYVHLKLLDSAYDWNSAGTLDFGYVNSMTITSLIFSCIIGAFLYICSSMLLSKGVDL